MSGARRPLVPDQRLAIGLGLVAFAAGWALLYDAWEGRGQRTPRPLRPFTWW